jgi:hypothetical protein
VCQILRYALPDGIVLDTILLIGALVLMGLVAWLSEWRDRAASV